MTPFMIYWVISTILAAVWAMLLVKINRQNRRFLGVSGAWIATLVLAALWKAEAVPWLWIFVKGVLFIWLGALILIVIGAIATWRAKQPLRWPLLFCALLSIAVNVAAGIQFLWIATVSPGGV